MFYILVNDQQIYKPLDDLLVLFNPKLTLEIGKAGSLEFDIPTNNPFYDKLNQLTTEVSVDMDDDEIFHGRVLSVERGFNNVRHVYCEGDLSYLIDSVQKGSQYNGTTHDLFERIIANHNARVNKEKRFIVGTVNIENRDIVLVGHSEGENINAGNIDYKQIAIDSIVGEWNNSYDYIQTCLIDYCGGYLRTRRVDGNIYIDLLSSFGSTSVQEIELGKNLLNLSEELSVEDVFTVLIPLGEDNLTIASVNGGSDELVDKDAVARFGRIVRTHVFNNVTNASTLMENARRFLSANLNIPRTISVRAVDLHLINKDINPIRIGDKVTITSYIHEIDDSLTCTKIEYDLEKPDNNNYTFGNSRQTLTQRYREDVRLNNDTYGNSASPAVASAATPKAVSSAGVAAATAAQAAEEEQTKALNNFYETWIKDGEEPGKVSLGALYRQYYNGKEVLLSQCGIDLDGKTGNVNISSLHNTVDAQGKKIASNEAQIKIVQEDTSASIESVVTRQNTIEDREASHYAGVTQKVDDLSSEVAMVAKDVNEVDDRLTSTVASVKTHTDDLESRVTTTASYLSEVDGKLTGHVAEITAWANETESALELKADKVYVDGQLEATSGKFDDLISGRTVASKIRATEILAGSISYWSEGGSVAVPSMNHSHNFAIIEKESGNVEISIGMATNTIPQKQSFNIANTKFYKDNVAAKTVKSFALDNSAQNTDGTGIRYESGNKRFLVYVKAVMSDDSEKTGGPLYVPARPVYNAGMDDGASTAKVTNVTIGVVGQASKSEEDNVYYAKVPVTAIAEGTKSDNTKYTDDTYSKTISIDVTAVYQQGKADGSESGSDDVSVTSLGLDPDSEISYSSSVNNYYIPIKALLSNSRFRTTTLTVSGEAAQNAVTVSSMVHYKVSGEQTVTYNSDDKTLNASVQANLSNGQNVIRTVAIPADLAYDAGKNDVSATVGLNTSWSESSTGYIYETANRRFKVRLISNLSNNKVYGATVYIPALDAYNAGIDAGAQTAYFSNVTTGVAGEPSYSSDDGVYYSSVSITGTARGTKADGSYYTSNRSITRSVDVSAVYSAGRNAADVNTVTTIAATADNYSSYDRSINPSTASLYTSGNYTYGLASINLDNGKSKVLRFRVPVTSAQVSSIVVTRSHDPDNYDTIAECRPDWDLSTSGKVFINVNLEAFSANGTSLGTSTGKVNATDIAGFWAPTQGSVLNTTADNYSQYSSDLTFYIQNFLYTSGSYKYARVQLKNVEGNNLRIVRVQLDADSSGDTITRAALLNTTASTYSQYDSGFNVGIGSSLYRSGSNLYGRIGLYNSSGTLKKTLRTVLPLTLTSASTQSDYSDYYNSGGKWYLNVHAKSGSKELFVQGIDVQFAVDYGAQQGGSTPSYVYRERDEDGNWDGSSVWIRMSDGTTYSGFTLRG